MYTSGKEKPYINILILNVLRHYETSTSYLWPLQLQEMLKVGPSASRHLLCAELLKGAYVFLVDSVSHAQ